MVIDIHLHMWSASQRYPRVGEIAHSASKIGYRQPEHVPLVPDVSVLLMADYHMRLGDAIFSPEGENQVQVQMSQRHQGRLIPFFGMDPGRPDAATLFELALKEWVGAIRSLPSLGEEYGVRFDDRDVDAILGGNSARVLGL